MLSAMLYDLPTKQPKSSHIYVKSSTVIAKTIYNKSSLVIDCTIVCNYISIKNLLKGNEKCLYYQGEVKILKSPLPPNFIKYCLIYSRKLYTVDLSYSASFHLNMDSWKGSLTH